jgi:hypothetical protein
MFLYARCKNFDHLEDKRIFLRTWPAPDMIVTLSRNIFKLIAANPLKELAANDWH